MNVRERCGASASVRSAAAGRSIAFGDSEESELGARTRMPLAAAAALVAGTGSAATASAAAATGIRCSFDTASRTLDVLR